jgi:hypothetical protein
MRPLALPAFLCALLLAHAAAAHAEWIVDAEGGIVYEDNLTRATRQADRRSDIALAPALSLGHYFQLTDAMSLLAVADFKGSLYPRFEGLSNLSSTVTLGVKHKLGLGAFAPWLRVSATAGALDYGDNVRDSSVVGAAVQVGQRFSERIDLQAGYTYETLNARNGVFDQDSHTFGLKGNVALTGAVQLTLGYSARLGDLVVHKAPVPGAAPAPHSRLVNTFDTPLVALRIDATTHIFAAAVSYALTPRAALNVGYEYQISIGPLFSYPNNLGRASFDYSF